jgi:hypothetical protein
MHKYVDAVSAPSEMAEWAFRFGTDHMGRLVAEAKEAEDPLAYVESLATEGGITAAIFRGLDAGHTLEDSLLAGHGRYLELLDSNRDCRWQ